MAAAREDAYDRAGRQGTIGDTGSREEEDAGSAVTWRGKKSDCEVIRDRVKLRPWRRRRALLVLDSDGAMATQGRKRESANRD